LGGVWGEEGLGRVERAVIPERYRTEREREECNDRRREEKARICTEMKNGRG
jgi:hypothetical protein